MSARNNQAYCISTHSRRRLPTHEVKVGEIGIGGSNPIRIQSMTTTDTMDTAATIQQALRMAQSGSELVRITAPSLKEAQNLAEIKKGLRAVGCNVPLIADIHYTPNAAELAARIVEKVRVNPGNYADKKKFEEIEYSDAGYEAELQRIHDRFAPLVKICKEYGTAMRIGTNHGSLSDRIMSRYGDTPLGMVESAFEFLRICEMYNYDQVVLSMKASNPQVMVQAYRLLANKMLQNGKLYPLHLGVTEAGEGEDGRIKSAQGIGALLMDGLGDTVRVSLTEDPEFESPVAKFLTDIFTHIPEENEQATQEDFPWSPFEFNRRETIQAGVLGKGQVPRVIAQSPSDVLSRSFLSECGYQYNSVTDKYNIADMAADFVWCGNEVPGFQLPGALRLVHEAQTWAGLRNAGNSFPFFNSPADFILATRKSGTLNFVKVTGETLADLPSNADFPVAVVLESSSGDASHEWRKLALELIKKEIKYPLVLKLNLPGIFSFYADENLPDAWRLSPQAKQQLFIGAQTGSLLVDGLVDALWVVPGGETANRASFGVLQASRLRITKTEYISCPSCGRTLFDLQETTARIRKRTEHLKGVKIGIMGCIVNGPGEMADADYGYVGVGPGKIALYKGKTVVEKGVKTEDAVDKLIELIRSDGRWVEPVN